MNKLKQGIFKLLRWSEQYTKTDMVYLVKGGFWTWLGKGVQILTGTAIAVAFANLLPKELYGNYKYIIAMAAILSAFTLNAMTRAVVRSVSRGYEGSLKRGVKEVFKWSGFIFLSSLAVSGYYFFQGNNLLGFGMLIIALFQPIIQTANLYQAHLMGKKLFKTHSVYLIYWELTQAALLVIALFFTNNPLILVGLLMALNTIFACFYLWKVFKKYVKNSKVENGMISYGKHLSLINILSIGAQHIDKVLVFQLLGAVPTAIYSFALLPTDKLSRFFHSIGEIILPKFSNRPVREIKKTIGRKAVFFFAIMLGITMLLILLFPTIFNLLFPEYLEAIPYAQVLAISLIFTPQILFSQALMAHMKKKALYITNITSDILKILLLVILLPLYGIWGAVYAVLSFYAYQLFIKMIYFYKS